MNLPEFLFEPKVWIAFWLTLTSLTVATFVVAIRQDHDIQKDGESPCSFAERHVFVEDNRCAFCGDVRVYEREAS